MNRTTEAMTNDKGGKRVEAMKKSRKDLRKEVMEKQEEWGRWESHGAAAGAGEMKK